MNQDDPMNRDFDELRANAAADAARRVKAPAIVMLILVGITALQGLYGVAMSFVTDSDEQIAGMVEEFERQQQEMRDQGQEDQAEQMKKVHDFLIPIIEFSMNPLFGVLGLLLALFTGFCALQMLRLKSWGLGVTGSILVMLPLSTCCCCIGAPIGIWSLIVLMNTDVKAAFQGDPAAAAEVF
ncbi:MAG: hypothetical protein R3F20_16690 [Planctomycetota bacterium]